MAPKKETNTVQILNMFGRGTKACITLIVFSSWQRHPLISIVRNVSMPTAVRSHMIRPYPCMNAQCFNGRSWLFIQTTMKSTSYKTLPFIKKENTEVIHTRALIGGISVPCTFKCLLLGTAIQVLLRPFENPQPSDDWFQTPFTRFAPELQINPLGVKRLFGKCPMSEQALLTLWKRCP